MIHSDPCRSSFPWGKKEHVLGLFPWGGLRSEEKREKRKALFSECR